MGILGKAGKSIMRPRFPPFLDVLFLVSKRTFYLSGEFLDGCFISVGPGILGPGNRDIIPGQLSVEFVDVGGWLASGDLAMDSCAQFLAVAETQV